MVEGLNEELQGLMRFHGHLGPYVTVGLRMGKIAAERLGDYHGLHAKVRCVLTPPMSCVADGVQFSSGCTLGKGNIELSEATNPEALFVKGKRKLLVSLKPEARRKIDSEMSKEYEVEQSLYYYRLPEEDLFDVSEK